MRTQPFDEKSMCCAQYNRGKSKCQAKFLLTAEIIILKIY
jgi:hypothetical protein